MASNKRKKKWGRVGVGNEGYSDPEDRVRGGMLGDVLGPAAKGVGDWLKQDYDSAFSPVAAAPTNSASKTSGSVAATTRSGYTPPRTPMSDYEADVRGGYGPNAAPSGSLGIYGPPGPPTAIDPKLNMRFVQYTDDGYALYRNDSTGDEYVDRSEQSEKGKLTLEALRAQIAASNRGAAGPQPHPMQMVPDGKGGFKIFDPNSGQIVQDLAGDQNGTTSIVQMGGNLVAVKLDRDGNITGEPSVVMKGEKGVQWLNGPDGSIYKWDMDNPENNIDGKPTLAMAAVKDKQAVTGRDGMYVFDPGSGEMKKVSTFEAEKSPMQAISGKDGLYTFDPNTGEMVLKTPYERDVEYMGHGFLVPKGKEFNIKPLDLSGGHDYSYQEGWKKRGVGGDRPGVGASTYSDGSGGLPRGEIVRLPSGETIMIPTGGRIPQMGGEMVKLPNGDTVMVPRGADLKSLLGTGSDTVMGGLSASMPMMNASQLWQQYRQSKRRTGIGADDFVPPVDPAAIEGTGNRFGQPNASEGIHKGTDLQAQQGTPVVSPFDGRIVNVEYDKKGLGLHVTVQNEATGEKVVLSHMAMEDVDIGQEVRAGDPIGTVGSTGNSSGPHLDVRKQDSVGNYEDPAQDLGPLASMPMAPNTQLPDDQMGMMGMGSDRAPGPQEFMEFLSNTYKGWQNILNRAGNVDGKNPPVNLWDKIRGAGKALGIGADYPEGTQWETDDGFMSYENDPGQIDWNQPGPIDTEAQYGVDPSFYPEEVRERLAEHNGASYAGGGGGDEDSYVTDPYYEEELKMRRDQGMATIDNERNRIKNDYEIALKNLEQQLAIHKDTMEYQRQKDALDEQYRRDMLAWDRERLTLEQTFSKEMEQLQNYRNIQNSALKNPWLQQLSGMTPEQFAPGGPASSGYNLGSVIRDLLGNYSGSAASQKQWGAQPAGAPVAAPNQMQAAPNQGGQPSIGAQMGSGQGGLWSALSGASPYELAALRTNVEMTGPGNWEKTNYAMRNQIASEGGPTSAPATTQLQAATSKPEELIGKNFMADFFGQTPDQYWQKQKKQWGTSSAANVAQKV